MGAVQRRVINISSMFLIAMAVLALYRDAQGQCEGQWDEGLSSLPGLDGNVYAMTVFNDGSGDALYVGGSFTVAGDTMAAGIAKWNGSRWSALGSGMGGPFPNVYALTVFDDGSGSALYAGGKFITAGGVSVNKIAKWNGTSWSALESGVGGSGDPRVFALAVFDDGGGPALYAGGDFTTAGSVSANYIAKWDGANWSALNSGTNGSLYALTVFDDGGGPALYAGGGFGAAGEVTASRIAKWDGSSWSALGSGVSGGNPSSSVQALTVFDDGGGPALYAGGTFSNAGSVTTNSIAKWDGVNWSAVGSGMSQTYFSVSALTVFDDGGGPALFAGGWFATAEGPINWLAKWNGSIWSALGSGINYPVRALAVFDDGGGPALYAGGLFTTAGAISVKYIAKWDGANWSDLESGGTNNYVLTLEVYDDGSGAALYAGGSFTTAGSVSANYVAKWDGRTWSALGAGMNSPVGDMAIFDDGGGPALYAGGGFTTAGGGSANYIAKWNGTTWSAVGAGPSTPVYPLAVFDDGSGPALYGAGGESMAKWDGATWSSFGLPPWYWTRGLHALAVFDAGEGLALYGGGMSNREVGVDSNHLVRWDGATWSTALWLEGDIYDLTVFDDGAGSALYVAVGGNSYDREYGYIIKWNGSNCTTLGPGFDYIVTALSVFDDGGGPAIYAGGYFSSAGGVIANRIARWDGASWSAMGSGMNGVPSAMEVFDDGGGPALYVGGRFTIAGGNASAYFARWSPHPETDAAGFAAGMTGPTATPDCKPYDYDCDGDVDLRDYTRLLFRMERD